MFIIDDLLIGVPLIVTAIRAVFKAKESASGAAQVVEVPSTSAAPDNSPPMPAGSGETIIAVKGLESVSPAVRQALLDAATQLMIPVDSIALVIESESGWNPAALNPLPAAGYIQLTAGARLPGFTTADAVRAITAMDPVDQIRNVVVPFYARFGSKLQHADPGTLYMYNFLPGVAGEPETKVLGVREGAAGPGGEAASDRLMQASPLSLGTIYGQNAGFDAAKKGYFTIGDVHDRLRKLEAQVGGQRIDVAGNIIDATKTAAGCGQNWASFKSAGGCGNWDFPEVCGNWAPWGETYDSVRTGEHADISPRDVARSAGGPGGYVPPGFENAYEVFDEPDVRTAGAPAPGHEGWGEVRMADGRVAAGPAKATPEQAAIIQRGILPAVQEASQDPIQWVQLGIGEYQLMVSAEPVAVNGLRLPTSKDDAFAIARLLRALPITKAISDARWANAKRVPAQPLNDPRGALYNDPDQVVAYNQRMGPNTGEFVDGYWKELTVSPAITQKGPHSMAQYGFKNADGSMFEHGGPSNHDKAYKDYSDTPTYVSRQATKNGVSIDLLDEYAAGGPLTAALPPWEIAELRGGDVGV